MMCVSVLQFDDKTRSPSNAHRAERSSRGNGKQRHESCYMCHSCVQCQEQLCKNSNMNTGCDERVCICQQLTEDMQYITPAVQWLLRSEQTAATATWNLIGTGLTRFDPSLEVQMSNLKTLISLSKFAWAPFEDDDNNARRIPLRWDGGVFTTLLCEISAQIHHGGINQTSYIYR